MLRARQGKLLETEHPQAKRLLDLASEARELIDERKGIAAELKAKRRQIAEAMHKQRMTNFVHGALTIEIVDRAEAVKISWASPRKDGEEGDDAE